MTLLTVQNLRIAAGNAELVHDVNVSIARNERVGLIGASGSGKTLTALAIAGLLPDELSISGSIRLDGFPADLVGAPDRVVARIRGSRIGMVFQEPLTALNPTMAIGRQVAEVIRRHNRGARSRAEIDDRVRHLLDATGLTDVPRVVKAYPHQLSGGQRQRVVLTIALANGPDLLICDEPTTALDVTVQARVLALIEERVAAVNAALLFISHDLAVVASVCDRILVMDQGAVVEEGPATRLLTDPQHPRTRELLDGVNSSPVQAPAHDR